MVLKGTNKDVKTIGRELGVRFVVEGAVRDLKTAHEIDPNNPDTLALPCNCYLISGRVSFARPLIDRRLAVNPLTPLTRCMPGFADLMEGNFPAAIAPYQQMFEMDPGNPMARLFVPILAVNGRSREMRKIVEALPRQTRDTIPARLTYFFAHALAGSRSAALTVLTPEIEAMASATDLFSRFLA